MQSLSGKTAVISGGAEGIGLALAKGLGALGMNIVLGDIEAKALARAQEIMTDLNIPHLAVEMDV